MSCKNTVCVNFNILHSTEPASPPLNVSITDVTSTTITVTWDEVPAIERNGIITEYEVEYNQSTFDVNSTQTVNVTSRMVELTDLHEFVNYLIRVRAYTSVGPGPYSSAINRTTDQDGQSHNCHNTIVTLTSTHIHPQCLVVLHEGW